MKIWLRVIGGIIAAIGLLQVGNYFYSYYLLDGYGTGYLTGSLLLAATGIVLVFIAYKRGKKK